MIDRAVLFDSIKSAREILAVTPFREVGDETQRGYKAEYLRLWKKGEGKPDAILNLAKQTKSASTWYRRRAAMAFGVKHQMIDIIKKQDVLQRQMTGPDDPRYEQWVGMVKNLRTSVAFLAKVQQVTEWPPRDERQRRETKKRSLRGLPDDWREKLAQRLPKYRLPYLVAAATGCRPAELVTGVHLDLVVDKDGSEFIKATINGAKVRDENGQPVSGQPVRVLYIEVDLDGGSLSRQIVAHMQAGQSGAQVASEKLFSGAVRDAARREWPGRKDDLTAYSLRHQFAADRKAEKWPDTEVARMLGHISDKTASYYGDRQQRRPGGVRIKAVTSSREVTIKTRQTAIKKPKASPTPKPR